MTDINWVPMSDREPKMGGNYLVTVIIDGERYVSCDDYYSYGWDDWGEDVIAWAEKPEPYGENMITSKQMITVTRDDPRFDMINEALKERGFRMDEDTVSATFTKSDICAPIWSSDAEMTKLSDDDEQIEKYKDWIVRYYASHDDIPEGMSDGGIVGELVRCRDCVHYQKWIKGMYCTVHDWYTEKTDYCSRAERREE